MPAAALTDRSLRSLPPESDTPDALMPGLIACRRAKGITFWAVAQRNGKRHKVRLGAYPVLSLAAAREAARQALLTIEAGRTVAPAATTGEGLDLYLAALDHRAKDAGQVRWLLDRFARPALGAVPLDRLHRRDLQAVVDAIAEGRAKVEGAPMSRSGSPSTAGRLAAMLMAAVNWLHKRGHIDLHPCPAGLDAPAQGEPRDRTLTDAEIKAIWQACEGREPSGRVLRLLLLTACRREEIGGLRPEEIERDAQGQPVAIRLPAERTKSARPHRVPLPPMAAGILAGAVYDGAAVFPGRYRDQAFKGWSRAVEDIQRLSGTEGWTPHDLRRTAATGMARLGTRPDVIEAALNHAPPRLGRIYNRHDYQPEIAAALAAWGERVAALVRIP